MQLSEKGLCKAVKLRGDTVQKASEYLPLGTEADIFAALGLEYREPTQREDKSDVLVEGTSACWFQKKRPSRKRPLDQIEAGGAERPMPLPAPRGV